MICKTIDPCYSVIFVKLQRERERERRVEGKEREGGMRESESTIDR